MKVRLGYVSIALNLPKVTASSSVTYANYSKIARQDERIEKLKKVTLSNLNDLYKILQYNLENDIHFYRITSALVPLVTHPEVDNWDYRTIFRKDFEHLGNFIKKNNMRVDTHPNEFNVINSTRDDVVKNTVRNLWVHAHLFEDMGYDDGKMVLHIGSAQGGHEKAIERFIENFNSLPEEIRERVILENDDKTFRASEVLYICERTGAPMVFDAHHHLCNNEGESPQDFLGKVFDTWDGACQIPKLHFSSPKDGGLDRKHADFIDCGDFMDFIHKASSFNRDIDIMLEAKAKDRALFKLVSDLKEKADYRWIDKTTFEV